MVFLFFKDKAKLTTSIAISFEVLLLFRSFAPWWSIITSGEKSSRQPLRWYLMAFVVALDIDLMGIEDLIRSFKRQPCTCFTTESLSTGAFFLGGLLDFRFSLFFQFVLFTFTSGVTLLSSFFDESFLMNCMSYFMIPIHVHDHVHVIYLNLPQG